LNPKVTEQINGYSIEWPEHNLIARIGRLKTKDGQVRGELEIKQKRDDKERLLLVPTSFNFSSEPTRVKFAKQLTGKLSLKIDWREVFDSVSEIIQRMTREGDSYIEVYPDENTSPPKQLIGGLIYEGVQNIIFGEKGVNKSTIAYTLGLAVTLPWVDNPFSLIIPSESIKTLILDWETDENIFRYYVSRLQKGMNIPICSIFYRRCALPLIDDIEAIQRHIESTRTKLLIIDSLGAAAGGERGELKGSESALLFNSALRKLKLTSLIIGQTAKSDNNNKNKTIFGSTYFTYYARNIWELSSGTNEYDDIQHLALFHRECNLGKRMQPIGLQVTYMDNGGIKIERESISLAEFAHKVSIAMKIKEELKHGAKTSKELQDALDATRGSIDTTIQRLKKTNQIIDTGNKKWGLVVI